MALPLFPRHDQLPCTHLEAFHPLSLSDTPTTKKTSAAVVLQGNPTPNEFVLLPCHSPYAMHT